MRHHLIKSKAYTQHLCSTSSIENEKGLIIKKHIPGLVLISTKEKTGNKGS